MRNVEAHLLEDKMDEAVTHYINSHQPPESVHVDANSLSLNVQDDNGGRVVTVMHPQSFPPQMCRQVSVVEGAWVEDLLDPDSRLAALVAHLAEHSRSTHHMPHGHSKGPVRSDVDASVILDAPMRLFNGQTLEHQQEPIVVEVPPLPPLPPLQDMKRCPEADWFSKDKNTLKDDQQMLAQNNQVLDMGVSQKQHSKKSLPHKKRISRKLKRNGCSTPQQDIVVINCNEEVQQEEILPDNFVAAVQHQDMPEDTHHMSHEMRALFICQICGEFYGDEQLKFYQHLKNHYEPAITIIENPVPDLGIDKMTNTCIVDNVPTLPDSIVELSLENTVPKTMYQPIDKHILYTSNDKLSYNTKVYQTIDKEDSDKTDIYRDLDKLEMYFCAKCNKTFRKQKQYEAHLDEAHSSSKIDEMNEFSEPEDLMEGIHVAVEEGEAYEHVLPHLTVENGHVHQEHVRQWYLRNAASTPPTAVSPLCACACGGAGFCASCACAPLPLPPHAPHPPHPPHAPHAPQPPHAADKEENLQRIFEQEQHSNEAFTSNETQTQNPTQTLTPTQNPTQTQSTETDIQVKVEPGIETKNSKKKAKTFKCGQCDKVFSHKNSLLYHELMHGEKKEVCRDCGKKFYTIGALKVHKRVHNGDRPCKCDECGREFRQWSDLKYHKASIHSNQKEYKCDFCGKEFARRYSLNVHRRIHTGERKYKCDYCTKTFRASSYRVSHMRIHTGCKPYKCTHCDKSFRVTYDLRRHMAIHDKARVLAEDPKKNKDNKDKKPLPQKPDETKQDKNKIEEKKETRLPVLKTLLDKKVKLPKKSPKKAPNVTVQSRDFKINDYEVLERQDQYKFKEVYAQKDVYTDEMRLDRNDLGLRLKNQTDEDRLVYRENTDGKMHVYTQIDRSKDYEGPIVTNTVSLSDLRNLDREVREPRTELHGETIENGFFERLSAFYNIPAV